MSDLPINQAEYYLSWLDSEQRELVELMEEPPGGINHGRTKVGGAWRYLEPEGTPEPSYKAYAEPRKHGTSYTYMRIGCRCTKCRQWMSDYQGGRRKSK